MIEVVPPPWWGHGSLGPDNPKIKESILDPLHKHGFKDARIVDITSVLTDNGWGGERIIVFLGKSSNGYDWDCRYLGVKFTTTTDGDLFVHDMYATDSVDYLEYYPITAVLYDGKYYYSRHRHDFVIYGDKRGFIDGGRDYTKWNGCGELVEIAIVDGVFHRLDELI